MLSSPSTVPRGAASGAPTRRSARSGPARVARALRATSATWSTGSRRRVSGTQPSAAAAWRRRNKAYVAQ
eukprot:7876336-Lingulodinium_polyedra.AAC.1